MATNFKKFQKLLEELFQLDQADLDFGIYRIMNQKRDEVVQFLEKDLLPQVKEAFSHYKSADKAQLQEKLDNLTQQIESAGMNPEDSPKVKGLQGQIADSSVDVTALENEVFSHLFNFFRRYYHEGDFISLRRYKEGVYAIPYEGEEVKLHWANHDQYYVKSSEYFRDYIFTMSSGKRVRVHLVAASSEQDNKKEAPGKERRFIICEEDPVYEEDGELFIRFEYRPDNQKKKQDALNSEAVDRVLQATEYDDWIRDLSAPAPTKSNPNRTVLEKHLTQYTDKNTFDYFIHKDLGGFLRRELDFYIKNEVMHLDDIEHDTAPRVEQYLSKIRVLRKIAHKVIQFLEQLENFQKALWLKKKFVVATDYCLTLDRVPEELYKEIAANDAQREEWVRLFAIDKVEKDLNTPGYSEPLSVEFLKENSFLLLDTKFFGQSVVDRILADVDDLSQHLCGVLVQSENSQALRLMGATLKGTLDCIYIDPPYNTDATPLLYKNGYRNSTWVTMMNERLETGKDLLADTGVLCATIDDTQQQELLFLMNSLFGKENILGNVSIRINPSGRITLRGFGQSHEYAIFAGASEFASIGKMRRDENQEKRFNQRDEKGAFEWRNFRREGSSSERASRPRRFFPLYVSQRGVRLPDSLSWDDHNRKYVDILPPKPGEQAVYPIDSSGGERVWRYGIERVAEEFAQLEARPGRGGETNIYYKYRPNEEGVLPLTMWFDSKYSATEHGTAALKAMFGGRNVFTFPKSLHAVHDCIDVAGMRPRDSACLDYFAGSGTTGHAVIEMNRRDGGDRRYVLVEMGEHFESALKPRIAKAIYSQEWKGGLPVDRAGVSHMFKYISLESYEDALNNLAMKRTDQQASLLDQDTALYEQYVLSYMLDVESRGSQSLLNLDSFRNPDEYKLQVERNGETRLINVDLVETFNWLLGLTVKHIDVIRGLRVVEGKNPDGARTLVLWRNLDSIDNTALDKWFKKQDYNTKDQVYDLIYVNGDNNLENLRRGDQTWKVRLIEEEFGRLMFDVEDI